MYNAAFSWRKFQFFDKETLTEAKESMQLFRNLDVTCSTSGRGYLIFGDTHGKIYIVNRDFEQISFSAYEGEVIALQQLTRSDVLASLGKEAKEIQQENPTVKIWKVDFGSESQCIRTIPLFSNKVPEVPVTCFSLLEDQSQLAVGLKNGILILFEIHRNNVRQQLLITNDEGPCITGVHFREDRFNNVSLFVVTPQEVMTFFTKPDKGNAKEQQLTERLLGTRTPTGVTKTIIDPSGGCELGCSTLNEEKQLVVARKEAVFFYEPEEKGICFGFEGEKRLVGWFNNYLFLVCNGNKKDRVQMTIYDIKNKFIAYSATFDPIVNIVSEWGSIFVLVSGRRAYQLTEKDRQTKMEMLFRKNLYTIAISLANSQDVDRSYVTDIHQMYGDHLYSKGDYEGAIEQYVETINYIEPSYVIRKFLDAQRIHNLTRYLQTLHEKECATEEHTTLLLNCYTKLKDVEKLDQFIKTSNLKFDVKTAIKVCRQASYYEHALYLAQKHQEHELYLKIQAEQESEDKANYRSILNYIWSLDEHNAQKFIKEYGTRLARYLTDETTTLFLALCVNYEPRPLPNLPGLSVEVVELRERSISRNSYRSSSVDSKVKIKPALKKCKPEDFIHLFLGQPEKLKTFLEESTRQLKCGKIVYNTLLELYLRLGGEADQTLETKSINDRPHPAHQQIMALLKSHQDMYDINHALVLVKSYGFEKGILFLYKQLDLYHEILQHHMERDNHAAIIQACKNHGDAKEGDPYLWVIALTYFADKKETSEEEIIQILDHVERHGLLSPLRIVQILSRNKHKPFSVLKDYIIRTLQAEYTIIEADEKETLEYKQDTHQMRQQIEQIRTRSTTFQGTKCGACTSLLSLPAIHFMCKHSFHQRCIVDSDRECPTCATEFRRAKEMNENLKKSSTQHDTFFKQLYNAPDGFQCAAEYFGRGIFDNSPGQ